jgi:hypothetical protein
MAIVIHVVDRRYRSVEWYHVPAGVAHSAHCHGDTEEIEFWFSVGEDGSAA